jgi:hypothetical protein
MFIVINLLTASYVNSKHYLMKISYSVLMHRALRKCTNCLPTPMRSMIGCSLRNNVYFTLVDFNLILFMMTIDTIFIMKLMLIQVVQLMFMRRVDAS